MFCPNCGVRTVDGAAFCSSCGYKLSDPVQPVSQQPAPADQEPVYAPPVVEVPVTQEPVAEEPVVEVPVVEEPVAEEPVVEEPVVEEPVVEEPAVEEPVIQEPVYVPPVQPVYEQPAPVVQAPPAQQPVWQPKPAMQNPPAQNPNGRKVPKVSGFAKISKYLIIVTLLLATALLAWSAYLTVTTDVMDYPAVKFGADLVQIDVDEIDEQLEGVKEYADEKFEELEDHLEDDEVDAFTDLRKALNKLNKKSSLLTIRDTVKTVDKVSNKLEYIDEVEKISDVFGQYNASELIDMIFLGLMIGFAVLLLLVLLGGLCKSPALTIVAMIFTVLVQVVACGLLWAGVTLVVYILQAIFCAQAKKAKLYAKFV